MNFYFYHFHHNINKEIWMRTIFSLCYKLIYSRWHNNLRAENSRVIVHFLQHTCMWSRTDLAELREIPRSADGPPQMSPTLKAPHFWLCFSLSIPVTAISATPSLASTLAAERGSWNFGDWSGGVWLFKSRDNLRKLEESDGAKVEALSLRALLDRSQEEQFAIYAIRGEEDDTGRLLPN